MQGLVAARHSSQRQPLDCLPLGDRGKQLDATLAMAVGRSDDNEGCTVSKDDKKPPKKKKKRRRAESFIWDNDGEQMMAGGYRRTRAGGGWRVLKKRLPR